MSDYKEFQEKHTELRDIIDLLHQAGMTDETGYPHVHKVCMIANLKDDFRPLTYLLRKYPTILTTAIKRLDTVKPFRPLPIGDELNDLQGDLHLGMVNFNGDSAYINPDDFRRGFTIVGENGAGKSYPSLRLLHQIFQTTPKQRGYNVVIIQIMKHDADFLIRHNPDLRIINWKDDFRYNIFECEFWDDPDDRIESSIATFQAVNYMMTKTQPLLNECLRVCKKNNIPITFETLFERIDTAKKNIGLDGYDAKNSVDRVKTRLHEYKEKEQLNVLHGFQTCETFTKEDVCLNFNTLKNDYLSGTIITDILKNIQRYHDAQQYKTERLRTLIVIDECRSVFPLKANRFDHDADKELETFVTTKRASGIGLITLAQSPDRLAPWLLENSAYFLSMPIQGPAQQTIKLFQTLTDDQINMIQQLPPFGVGIFRDRRFDRPYLLHIPGDLPNTRITDDEIDQLTHSKQYIKEHHELFKKREIETQGAIHISSSDMNTIDTGKGTGNNTTRPGTDTGTSTGTSTSTDTGINTNTGGIRPELRELMKKAANRFLDAVKTNYETKSFHPVDKICTSLGLANIQKDIINFLELQGLLVTQDMRYMPRGKSIPFPLLTEKAQNQLSIKKSEQIDPSHFRHTYYCETVHKWLTEQSLDPKREYNPIRQMQLTMDGAGYNEYPHTSSSDNDPNNARIDVYVKDTVGILGKPNDRIALEITTTVRGNNIHPNIEKCLSEFKDHIDKIIFVCEYNTNQKTAKAIAEQSGRYTPADLKKITYTTMFKFLEINTEHGTGK